MPARITPNPTAANIPQNLTPQEFAQLFRLRPEQAVKFLEGKGIAVTLDWRAMWQDEHTRAFTISRLTSPDLLETIQAKLVKSVAGDLSRKDWTKQVRELLQDSGWWGDIEVIDQATGEVLTTRFNANRLRLIYDVNTRTASAAGQWERFEKSKRALPYLRYVTKRDEKVREQHRTWNNLVLPVDHPFWNTHAPPNGWNCRCSLVGMTQKDYDKGVSPRGDSLYKDVPKTHNNPWYNKRTGKTEMVPVGIDPGWAYNPGKPALRDAALAKTVQDKMTKLSPAIAAVATTQLESVLMQLIQGADNEL